MFEWKRDDDADRYLFWRWFVLPKRISDAHPKRSHIGLGGTANSITKSNRIYLATE